MTDENVLRERAEKGRQAQNLLDHPLFVEAFRNLENEYINLWRNVIPANDPEARERAYYAIRALDGVRDKLKSMVNDGKISQRELKE